MYFIANWKMFGNSNSIKSINPIIRLSKLKKYQKAKIIYCPPYTIIKEFFQKTKKTRISVGAQNCHEEFNYGYFTGSINSKMIRSTGCEYIILGHSENRKKGDTDIIINKKIKSALKSKLKVIFCIGENLKEKRDGKTNQVIKTQISKGLHNIKNIKNVLIAYEPIWSIGTGIIPKNEYLKKQIIKINIILKKMYKKTKVKILYGGSVNPKNIYSLTKIDNINGFLVGGASLKSKKFIDIIKKSFN